MTCVSCLEWETDGTETNPVDLVVIQVTHLSLVDLMSIIQVRHSHNPSADLKFWINGYCWDYIIRMTLQVTVDVKKLVGLNICGFNYTEAFAEIL